MRLRGIGFLRPSQLPLRARVTLGVVIPLIVILGFFTFIEYNRHREVVLANLSLLAAHSNHVIEDNLNQLMLKSDFGELQKLLDSIGMTGDFRVVYLLDTSGKVIFAPDGKGVGLQLNNQATDCLPCHKLVPSERPSSVIVTASDGQRVFRSMNPIENGPQCARCHDPEKRFVGLLLTDIPTAPFEKPLGVYLRESLVWWIGSLIVVILVVNLVMNRFVLRRLERLAAAIQGFGQGTLPQALEEESGDEIGQLAQAFNTMATQVERRSTENRILSENLQRQTLQRGELLKRLISAQEDERKRLARELHDEMGQALSGLALQNRAIHNLIATDSEQAIEALEQSQALISETTDQMYDLIHALRPSILDDLGLVVALRVHAERTLAGTGLQFHLDAQGFSGRLPSEIEIAVYRIFQEALANSLRHARATQIEAVLLCASGQVQAEFRDNGQGFIMENMRRDGNLARGLGFLGMQERAALIGGSLEILSQPGEGTCIRLLIPLEKKEHGE